MKLFSKFLLTFICVSLLVFLVACQREQPKATIPTKLSVGYVSSGLTGLAVEVMKDKKFASKYGLDIEFVGFANPQALNQTFFLSKKVDVNIAAGANVVASQTGIPPQFVYFQPTLLNSVSLLVKTDKYYKSLADLKGRKIAWYGPLSGGGTGFMAICDQSGIKDYRKEFQLIQTTPGAEGMLLERGEVDAAIAFEPIAGKLIASGKYRQILGPFWKEWEQKTGIKMEMAGMAAGVQWYSANPEVAGKLIAAWGEAIDYINKNLDTVLNDYAKFTNLNTPEEKEYGKKWIPLVYVKEWGNLDQSILEQVKVLKKSDLLKADSLAFIKKK